MNCGRSSSVEWKLPKLQRRVRFPSPAPPRPATRRAVLLCPLRTHRRPNAAGQSAQHSPRASWGPRFRYKTRPTRATRCHFRYKTHPARATRCHFRYKTLPARAGARGSGTKLTLHAQNLPIWRVLLLLGEFYPVFVANKPSMASFLPHKHQHHHRHERNNTPTQHTKPRDERLSAHAPHTARRNETFTAPARHKQQKFAHFHHAGANFLSQHTPHTHARATFLSTNASASKRDPNKTFIIFDSVITSRPDRTDIANGVVWSGFVGRVF